MMLSATSVCVTERCICATKYRLRVCLSVSVSTCPSVRLYVCVCVCVCVCVWSRPNVCAYRDVELAASRRPCNKTYTRMVRVWKPNCRGPASWCLGFQRRFVSLVSHCISAVRQTVTTAQPVTCFSMLSDVLML